MAILLFAGSFQAFHRTCFNCGGARMKARGVGIIEGVSNTVGSVDLPILRRAHLEVKQTHHEGPLLLNTGNPGMMLLEICML